MISIEQKKGYIYALLGSFFATLMVAFVKLTHDVPNTTIVFFRNLIGIVFLLSLFFHKDYTLKTKHFSLHAMRSLLGLSGIYCYFFAVKHLHLSDAVVLANTFPLFMPLIILIWQKTTLSYRRILSLSLGFIGVLFVMKPSYAIVRYASLIGLLGGFCAAFAFVSMRKLAKTEPVSRILIYYFVFCVGVSFFPMLKQWVSISWMMWLYMFLIAVFAVLYQWFITKSYQCISASQTSAVMYSSVIFGGAFDWMLWNEVPGRGMVIGAILIIIGGVSTLLDRKSLLSDF